MLSDLAGALGSAVGDVVREVKSDMAAMTPPATAKPVDHSDMYRTVAQAKGGLAFVEVATPELAKAAVPMPVSTTPKQLAAPWQALLEKGRVCVDAACLVSSHEDITRYLTTLAAESAYPYTVGIVAADVLDEVETAQAVTLSAAMALEPRLFAAVGYGPRHLVDDLDALDDALTAYINDNPKVIALGVLGLDEPYAPYTLPQQMRQLSLQLELAADFGLPVLLGHRRSLGPLTACLEQTSEQPALIWADTLETAEELALVQRMGMQVLVRPEITYDSHAAYRDLLKQVPASRHLLGSGSVLVAPASRSGHAGGPENLLPTLKAYAALMNEDPADAREKLNRNARAVYVTEA